MPVETNTCCKKNKTNKHGDEHMLLKLTVVCKRRLVVAVMNAQISASSA